MVLKHICKRDWHKFYIVVDDHPFWINSNSFDQRKVVVDNPILTNSNLFDMRKIGDGNFFLYLWHLVAFIHSIHIIMFFIDTTSYYQYTQIQKALVSLPYKSQLQRPKRSNYYINGGILVTFRAQEPYTLSGIPARHPQLSSTQSTDYVYITKRTELKWSFKICIKREKQCF